MTSRRVLVLNHFAVPPGEPGGTRHAELFGALPGWAHLIIASRTNLSSRRAQKNSPGFCFVYTSPYRSNGISRILNWVTFAGGAVIVGLQQAIRRPRPDLVYASSPHLLAGVAGALISSLLRCPFVLEVRDLWPKVLVDMNQLATTSITFRALELMERWLYRRADRIVVLAEGVSRTLTQTGVGIEKISVIPNAADPEFFATRVSRDDARRAYGFTKLTFVYAGAHGPANGLDQLLEAAACVGDEIELVLVGDGVSRPVLMRRAAELGLRNVRFLPPVAKSEMPRLLRAADVGVHCLADVPLFRYGVSPNKLFDYMAAGRAVLTNTPGDVAELVSATDSGVAVSPGGLADGIRRIVGATEAERLQWGLNGMAHMSRNQSRQAMALRLDALLGDLVPLDNRT